MTPTQLGLARHALGLPNRQRQSYRNHYRCPDGEQHLDRLEWKQMSAEALAYSSGDGFYHLTSKGAGAAIEPNERLDPEDFEEIT